MILAIDCGSTSFKFGLFNKNLQAMAVAAKKLSYQFLPGGGVELDADGIQNVIRRGLIDLDVRSRRIEAIAITSQAQTFTVVDPQGKSICPFISWQDGRAGDACRMLKNQLPDFHQHCSFGTLLPALQVCQIKRRPILRNQSISNLPGYIVRLWSDQSVIDHNLAAMSGLYSLKLRSWWPLALSACKLHVEQLPRVVPIGSIAAMTTSAAKRFGLPADIPIILAGNDQTAAAFDAQLHRHPAILVTLGTAQVAYVASTRLPASKPNLIRGPYPGGLFYRMAADSAGGNIVNWAQTILHNCTDDAAFFAAAARGRYDLVFDASLDSSNGSWTGIGFHHTSADLARSILFTLCRRMATMIRNLRIPLSSHKILVIGGGSRQPIWIKLLSEALGSDIETLNVSALCGAARMAGESVQ